MLNWFGLFCQVVLSPPQANIPQNSHIVDLSTALVNAGQKSVWFTEILRENEGNIHFVLFMSGALEQSE